MEEFGFVAPILVDSSNRIIAGHGRLEAAKLQNMKEVPTVCVSHLTEDQIRAYMIADNKLAENADWNTEMLGDLIRELESGLHFDATILGRQSWTPSRKSSPPTQTRCRRSIGQSPR
jgi:ParB-like chromosome segregation protein Spo0J